MPYDSLENSVLCNANQQTNAFANKYGKAYKFKKKYHAKTKNDLFRHVSTLKVWVDPGGRSSRPNFS